MSAHNECGAVRQTLGPLPGVHTCSFLKNHKGPHSWALRSVSIEDAYAIQGYAEDPDPDEGYP